MTTGAGTLEAVRLESDQLQVTNSGMLQIGGFAADELLDRFGSPLNVVCAETLQGNYRRIRDAFAASWPGRSHVLYSMKANSTLAVRALLSREGAGGDCFGPGELQMTLACGTDPSVVALNGSDKGPDEIEAAVAAGVTINIDAADELDMIAAACRSERRARVNLRLKVLPDDLDRYVNPLHKTGDGFVAGVRRVKWGYSEAAAIELLRRMLGMACFDVLGFTCHIGHLSFQSEAFASVAAALGAAVRAIHGATGYVPKVLDLGGGWAPARDPSFRKPGLLAPAIEGVAHAVSRALLGGLPAMPELPTLWVEPGRYIVSNAVVLLCSAGAVKRDSGYCWMHVDASTNNLPRIDSGQFHHTILPASRMHEPDQETVEVVGGTCFRSVLGAGRSLPSPRRGDIVAILDAGMYAEVFATQFNSVPRPATVLLSPAGAEVIRVRETIEDVYRQQRMPSWLSGPPQV